MKISRHKHELQLIESLEKHEDNLKSISILTHITIPRLKEIVSLTHMSASEYAQLKNVKMLTDDAD